MRENGTTGEQMSAILIRSNIRIYKELLCSRAPVKSSHPASNLEDPGSHLEQLDNS